LIGVVTQSYMEYMANVININFRGDSNSKKSNLVSAAANSSSSSSSSASAATIEIAGPTTQEISRLAIHAHSKLILQVQLAVMTILGLLGYVFVEMRDTLPRDPCTIASSMSFLAGSRLCDPNAGVLPRGAELMTESQLDRALGRWRFSLGWWKARVGVAEEWEPANTLGGRNQSTDTMSTVEDTEYRFGVDVGRPSVPGYLALYHD
jgi:hypothetical protein